MLYTVCTNEVLEKPLNETTDVHPMIAAFDQKYHVKVDFYIL